MLRECIYKNIQSRSCVVLRVFKTELFEYAKIACAVVEKSLQKKEITIHPARSKCLEREKF